jgi:N-methylhydantoinase A
VLCPRASGVLCALGLAAAAPRRDISRTVMLAGDSLSPERLSQEREALVGEALTALAADPSRVRVRHELRYRGQSFELPVEEEIDGTARRQALEPEELRGAFARAHALRYGYSDDSAEVELVNIRVSVWGASPPLRLRPGKPTATDVAEARRIIFGGEPLETAVLRGELAPGTILSGPALCALPEATLLVPPGWSGEVDSQGTVHLSSVEES